MRWCCVTGSVRSARSKARPRRATCRRCLRREARYISHPRHAVQRGERALERAVEVLALVGARGGGGPLAQISVPELGAAREGTDRSLVDDGALRVPRGRPGREIAAPGLEAERVAQDVLLVRQVGLRWPGQRDRHRDGGSHIFVACAAIF